jgi:orotidine-5'-phosphate decarboxylase
LNPQAGSGNDPRIIVALDFSDSKSALDLTRRLDPAQCKVKVGSELFTAAGPGLVELLVQRGFGIFLDLKYHDIPNTVAAACRAAAQLGVWMLNVHALGGRAMMRAAREAIGNAADAPKLIAVTVLTSLNEADFADVGLNDDPQGAVLQLARLAEECAMDGVVCSAREASALRSACRADFCLVTPGIRPADAAADDQQRVATPRAALESGANYLVIGRPITRAPDPAAALALINRDIAGTIRR